MNITDPIYSDEDKASDIMDEPTRLRFEATDIDADLLNGIAVLTMETAKDGRVAVCMSRDVFARLSVRIQHALEPEPNPARNR